MQAQKNQVPICSMSRPIAMRTKLAIFLSTGEFVNADQQGACAGMNTVIAELPQTIPNSYVISSARLHEPGAFAFHGSRLQRAWKAI
jgi:hypothetical protein